MKYGIWIIALLIGMTSIVWAQPPMGKPHKGKWRIPEDTRILLEQVMVARLSKALNLDDAQTVLMVRRFSEHRAEFMKLIKTRATLTRELKSSLEKEASSEVLAKQLAQLRETEQKMATSRITMFDEVGAELDTVQRAKLYVFLDEFEQEIRNLLRRAHEDPMERSEGRGPGRSGRGKARSEKNNEGESTSLDSSMLQELMREGAEEPPPPPPEEME